MMGWPELADCSLSPQLGCRRAGIHTCSNYRKSGCVLSSDLLAKQGIRGHLELFQAAADAFESFIDAVCELEQIVFSPIDGAPIEHLPPIDYAMPVAAPVNQDQ